jgi:hypothetical protein
MKDVIIDLIYNARFKNRTNTEGARFVLRLELWSLGYDLKLQVGSYSRN